MWATHQFVYKIIISNSKGIKTKEKERIAVTMKRNSPWQGKNNYIFQFNHNNICMCASSPPTPRQTCPQHDRFFFCWKLVEFVARESRTAVHTGATLCATHNPNHPTLKYEMLFICPFIPVCHFFLI